MRWVQGSKFKVQCLRFFGKSEIKSVQISSIRVICVLLNQGQRIKDKGQRTKDKACLPQGQRIKDKG